MESSVDGHFYWPPSGTGWSTGASRREGRHGRPRRARTKCETHIYTSSYRQISNKLLCYSTETLREETVNEISCSAPFIDLCSITGQPRTCRTERRERRTGSSSAFIFYKVLFLNVIILSAVIHILHSLLQGTPRASGTAGKSGECVTVYCMFKTKQTILML